MYSLMIAAIDQFSTSFVGGLEHRVIRIHSGNGTIMVVYDHSGCLENLAIILSVLV